MASAQTNRGFLASVGCVLIGMGTSIGVDFGHATCKFHDHFSYLLNLIDLRMVGDEYDGLVYSRSES